MLCGSISFAISENIQHTYEAAYNHNQRMNSSAWLWLLFFPVEKSPRLSHNMHVCDNTFDRVGLPR